MNECVPCWVKDREAGGPRGEKGRDSHPQPLRIPPKYISKSSPLSL